MCTSLGSNDCDRVTVVVVAGWLREAFQSFFVVLLFSRATDSKRNVCLNWIARSFVRGSWMLHPFLPTAAAFTRKAYEDEKISRNGKNQHENYRRVYWEPVFAQAFSISISQVCVRRWTRLRSVRTALLEWVVGWGWTAASAFSECAVENEKLHCQKMYCHFLRFSLRVGWCV